MQRCRNHSLMLNDAVIIVAGGGNGLGEAVAIELGRSGATVIVNDLGSDVSGEGESKAPADETVTAVKDAGGDGTSHFGDISSLEYTESLIEDTLNEYGRIDGAVNFAGILRDKLSWEMSADDWDDVIRVHLRGHFALLRPLASHWRQRAKEGDGLDRQRSFLCISSRSAFGNPGQLNYSAAKAGVLGMTRTAARELKRYDVRVNALVPTAYTRMIDEIPEEKRPFTRDEMPPENVAKMVTYLMSNDAEGINGCTVRAAGDTIGLVSDPELRRIGVSPDGWDTDQIAEKFRSSIANGISLDRTEPPL